MADGDIRITLSFDDRDYTVRVKNAARELSAFQSRADRTGQSVQRLEKHMTSMTTSFRHAVQFFGMARFAILDFYNVFLQLPQHILKTSGELERMTKLMEGLSKATDDATRKAEALSNTKFIIQTSLNAPFDVKALSDSFVKMKSAGLDPMDGSFKALIDSVARFGGTSETLHRASVAIQQMAGKGVISMEELRQQLGEAVPNAMRMMADSMGLSMGKLVEHISKGEVKSDGALRRFALVMQARNAGSAQEMMDTWVGAMARLKTQFALFENQVATAGFANAMKKIVTDVNQALDSDTGRAAAVELGRALTTIVTLTADVVKGLYEFKTEIGAVATAILAVWGANKIFTIIAATFNGMKVLGATWAASTKAQAATVEAAYLKSALVHQTLTRQRMVLEGEAAVQEQLYAARRNATGQFVTNASRLHHLAQANMIRERIALINAEAAALARAATVARTTSIGMSLLTGPLGIILTALSLGAIAWDLWGNSAENAIKKATRNATEGTGDQGDLDALNSAIERQNKKLKTDRESLDRLSKGSPAKDGTGRANKIKDVEADIAASLANIQKLEADRDKIQGTVIKTAAERAVTSIQESTDKQNREIVKGYEAQRVLHEEERKRRIADAKSPAEIERIEKEIREKVVGSDKATIVAQFENARKNMLESRQQLATLRSDARETARANDGVISASAAKEIAIATARERELTAIFGRELINSKDANSLLGTTDFSAGKGKGKGTAASRGELEAKDPLTKAVLLAEGEVAKAQRLLDNVQEGVNTFAAKRNAIAQDIYAEIAAKKWDDEDKHGKATTPGEDDARAQKLITAQTKLMEIAEQKRAINILTKDQADLDLELGESSERLNSNLPEQASNLRSLAGAYAALGSGLSDEAKKAMKFDELANTALLTQATINVQNFTKSLMEQNAELMIGNFIGTEAQQKELAFANAVKKSDEEIQGKIRSLQQYNKEGSKDVEITALQAQAQVKREQMAEQHRLNMRTPMEKMAEDWKDSAKAMGDATAKWANDGVEAIVNFAKTGKFEFKSLVESILADILRIQLRQSLAAPLSGLLGTIGKAVLGGGGAGPTVSAAASAGSLDMMNSMFPMPAGFANGGIMTSAGRMPLNMYSSGGIANSPQMAMFGEGRMNEAYVPLPDGKTIPVTMKGGAGNVQINVINQSGTPVSAQQQGGARFDGEKMILDVVLSAMSRPGSFRDGVKGAMT
jgi:tape measure domain-containing protein